VAGRYRTSISNSNALEYNSQGIQHGILRAAVAIVTSGTPGPTDTYGLLFITEGGTTLAEITKLLISGYLTDEDPLTWEGQYYIKGDEQLVTAFRSITAVDITTVYDIQLRDPTFLTPGAGAIKS
jgi:hypothetical protein